MSMLRRTLTKAGRLLRRRCSSSISRCTSSAAAAATTIASGSSSSSSGGGGGGSRSCIEGFPHPHEREVFCNAELRLDKVKVVGFDYDYTLAEYTPALQYLIYDSAKKILLEKNRWVLEYRCPLERTWRRDGRDVLTLYCT
jgi:hypothetical protein